MDYQALFREKALEYFNLDAMNYYKPFSLENFLQHIETICKNSNDEYMPKLGKNKLRKLYDYYAFMCENPTALTDEDQLAIQEMKDYLKNNRGHAYGYFPYRKKFYEEEVGRYYELSLANKMNILANKDFILSEIEKKISFMDQCEYENKYIKKKIITPKIKQYKMKWAIKKVLCVCGKEYTRSCKFTHVKSKFHQKFIEDNKKPEPIIFDGGSMTLTITEN